MSDELIQRASTVTQQAQPIPHLNSHAPDGGYAASSAVPVEGGAADPEVLGYVARCDRLPSSASRSRKACQSASLSAK
jgi:hypothetical protein